VLLLGTPIRVAYMACVVKVTGCGGYKGKGKK